MEVVSCILASTDSSGFMYRTVILGRCGNKNMSECLNIALNQFAYKSSYSKCDKISYCLF